MNFNFTRVILGFLKLSLKKSRPKPTQDINKEDKNPDIIVLDESFDRLRNDFLSTVSRLIHDYECLKTETIVINKPLIILMSV